MENSEFDLDRRKHQRFTFQKEIFGILRSSSEYLLGQLVDLGNGGLSVICSESEKFLEGELELDIFFLDSPFRLVKIPVEPVPCHDIDLSGQDKNEKKKRLCVRFLDLMAHQRYGIEELIRYHTVKSG